MKKKLLLTFASITLFFCATAQTTVTISALGAVGSFNTGSVNNAGTKNDGNMININSTTNAGFAKFDLTTLPASAVIMSVNCAFTTYSTTSSGANNNLYGFIGNPAIIAGTALYTNCTSGTSINTSTWTANATNTKILNASGVTFVQTNVNSPQLCIGFARASTFNYNIYGYPGTAAQQPKLIITYSVSPPCSGTPNAGTATATSSLVCSGNAVNLNLTGSTSASGLTYQWQSSPDGLTWTSIPTATNIATTQTVTAPTYYQNIVSCATNTAASTFVFVNLTTPPFAGTISGPTNVNNGTVNAYTIAPTTGNIQWYVSTTPTGPLNSITGATTAINQTITAIGSGTVYYAVIASASGCTSDTSNVRYPVNINFPGDNVCDAIPLTIGASTVQYGLLGATNQAGEVVPPGTGCSTNNSWCNNTLNNTRWFTFVAPASGYVTIQSPDFDTQLAVWKAASCSDLLSASTATLIAANDDDINFAANAGVNFSSFLRAACLIPGATYYIQLDSYGAAISTDKTRVLITDMMAPLNTSFTGLAANYCLPAASSSLTPAVNGGVFTINTSTTSVTSFVPSTAGTFTVMHSIFSCKTTSTTVVANTPTVMAMTSNTSVCSGSSATLTASGATNYTWTSGGTASTEVVTPTAASVYTVTGATSGCSNSTTVSVGVISTPTVMAMTSNTAVCSGSSATLTASGATNYTWTSGGTASTEVVTPTAASVYTVTGATSGCSNSTTVSVGVTASPNVMAMTSNASVCAGSSATLSAMGATNYTWTSGGTASTEVVTPTGNTTYTLTGEANGCLGYSTISVGVNQIPTVSAAASQTLLCDNGSTGSSILTASSTATSFAWSNGATTMSTSVTPTTTTVYTVTATSAGCSADAFVTVTVSNCNGIKESIANGISIYPNPTNGVLNIAISSELAGSSTVEVYDAIGKLVIKDALSNDTNTINLSKLEDGMYLFKIINNDKAIKIGKVVKQ